jgi:hypothetical protein
MAIEGLIDRDKNPFAPSFHFAGVVMNFGHDPNMVRAL